MNCKKAIFSLIVFSIVLTTNTWPCTTFVLQNEGSLVFGRNLDWFSGSGLLIVNPANLEKTALVGPEENPAMWVSKYASVTFNQVGREMPFGGINEAGLVVEIMNLGESVYPPADERPAVQACQWVQYQLDNFSSVAEVIRSDEKIRISERFAKIHFLVCDKDGNVAAIEFLDGEMMPYSGDDLPVPVLANSTYKQSLAYSGTDGNNSLERFQAAANMVEAFGKKDVEGVDYAFEILDTVRQGHGTKWSVVYDMTRGNVYFKVFETATIEGEKKMFFKPIGSAELKYIDLNKIEFDNLRAAKVVDLEVDVTGCVNPFLVDYTTEANIQSITRAFSYYKQWDAFTEISEEDMLQLSKYPETLEFRD